MKLDVPHPTKTKGVAVKTIITNNLSFSDWAKMINAQYPEILAHMRKSTDPLDRAISKRIMQIAGEINPQKLEIAPEHWTKSVGIM